PRLSLKHRGKRSPAEGPEESESDRPENAGADMGDSAENRPAGKLPLKKSREDAPTAPSNSKVTLKLKGAGNQDDEGREPVADSPATGSSEELPSAGIAPEPPGGETLPPRPKG